MRVRIWGAYSALGAIIAVAAFATDQIHKWWMLQVYGIAEKRHVVITPFLDLVMVWNYGISYGLFQQDGDFGRYVLIAVMLLAVVCLVVWLASCEGRLTAVALGLVIGGALGNIVDRVVHGAVADFFSFHAFGYHWYVFNLADVAIVAGVVILLYDSFTDRRGAASAGGTNG